MLATAVDTGSGSAAGRLPVRARVVAFGPESPDSPVVPRGTRRTCT
ncbi:hypothetical protein [Halogeometricum sp. CBA1124]|nr:hypothetical protein [Halogeometricum sp. CBA1124]MUV58649.1 hypothetical protein [Halogeometricum sp. CBA1124]